jgi:hypothetical protein
MHVFSSNIENFIAPNAIPPGGRAVLGWLSRYFLFNLEIILFRMKTTLTCLGVRTSFFTVYYEYKKRLDILPAFTYKIYE